jgi:general stress protein YciG
MTEEKQSRTHLRGFASLTPERRREIASKGGRSVPAEKRSYSMNRELAAAAGKKGGLVCPPEKRTYSVDKELASRAGKIGGSAKRDPNP